MKQRKQAAWKRWSIGAVLFAAGAASGAERAWTPDMLVDGEKERIKSCMTSVKGDCERWAAEGGGGTVPRGLSKEGVAELAPNEKYTLSGSVQVIDSIVYLNVNLKEHPWLASGYRKGNPRYPLWGDASLINKWRSYAGRTVYGAFQAYYMILTDDDGNSTIMISIIPLGIPSEGTIRISDLSAPAQPERPPVCKK